MFDGLCFALRSGNAEAGQKLKAQPFLQHPGGRVERITPALDEIEVLIVKKLGNDGADGFGGIPFALGLPPDAEGKRLPAFALQLRQGSKGSREGTDVQVADELLVGLFHDTVTAGFFVLEPVEVLADIGFSVQKGAAHHPGHLVVHGIGGVSREVGLFQPSEQQTAGLYKTVIHGRFLCSCPVRRTASRSAGLSA